MISRACKRILHVFSRMGHGGAEMRTVDLMRRIDRDFYKLDFCVLSGLPGPLDGEIERLGGTVFACGLGLGFARRFRQLLRQRRFDVVHSHVHHASGYILRAAAAARVPVRVAHFRSSQDGRGESLSRRLQRRLMCHWIDRYATSILAVSEAAMRAAWRPDWQDDPRCEVIYNGLFPTPFAGEADRDGVREEFDFPRGCFLAIHVGRLAPEKNHGRLLGMFAELAERRPESRLLMVGWGEPECVLRVRHQIHDLGLDELAAMAGERADVPRLVKAADVMVFPSLWEGLPGAVLEACAAGTPVVASDLPAVREIARDLPLVRCHRLDEPDALWVRTIEAAAAAGRSEVQRAAARRRFARSRFAIDRCAAEMCRVWHGPPLEPVAGGPAYG